MSAKKSGLGRGFDGLIPKSLEIDSVASPGEQVKQISLSKIHANVDQPRKEFDQAALEELAASIKQHGVIQPLVVTPADNGEYRIVAGERRFRASAIAGNIKVPVIVRDHKELEELEIALVENVQRVDLSPLEQALSIVRLRDQFSMSVSDISKKLGKAETTISNIVRLLQLPEEAVEALQKGFISEGHARAILALKTDEGLQKELLSNIITHKLSVRAAEEFVKNKKIELRDSAKAVVSKKISKRLVSITKKNGIKAKLQTRKKGGLLQVTYGSDQELEKILGQLEK